MQSKIEEYRKNKEEMLKNQQLNNNKTNKNNSDVTEKSLEPDFFNEMQPKFKHPKKVRSF